MVLEGVDVSIFQGPIDWAKVAASGISFAIVRATVGLGVDPNYLTNVRGARASGLLVGAYHAFETSHDAEEQAKRYAGTCSGTLDIAPFLDFEGGCNGVSSDKCLRMAQTFCETADLCFIKTCGVYTYPDFWDRLTANATQESASWATNRPFWLALYPGKANPEPLRPFTSVDIHQYSGTSTDVIGVHTTCDRDRFYGTIEELRLVGAYQV